MAKQVWLFRRISLLALILSVGGCSALAQTQPDTITITNNNPYVFQGWGTSLAWWANIYGGNGISDRSRGQVGDALFGPLVGDSNHLGLNVVRYNIGASPSDPSLCTLPIAARRLVTVVPGPGQPVDLSQDANQLRILTDANRLMLLANQTPIYEAFANSPPWWLTNTNCPLGSLDLLHDNLQAGAESQYAQYMVAVVSAIQNQYGIQFQHIEPFNEPGRDKPLTDMPWGLLSTQEGAHFSIAEQDRVTTALCGALQSAGGIVPGISVLDGHHPDETIDAFKSYGSAARGCVSQLNTHTYFVNTLANTDLTPYNGTRRRELAATAANNSVSLWMSEFGTGGGANSMDAAMTLGRQIATDITYMRPAAWVYWQAVEDSGGWGLLEVPGLYQGQDSSPLFTKRFYALEQYSAFIRPGSWILSVKDPQSFTYPSEHALTIAAADDPYAPQTVSIAATNDTYLAGICDPNRGTCSCDSNNACKTFTPRNVNYDVSQLLMQGSVHVYRTSSTRNAAYETNLTITNGNFSDTQPPQAVTTYVVSPGTLPLIATITPGGPPVTVTTAPGEDVRLKFQGKAGQRVSLLAVPGTNYYKYVYLVRPDGTIQATLGDYAPYFMDVQTLATTGTYELWVQHAYTNQGPVTLTLYDVPADVSGTIAPGGSPVVVTTTVPGQNATLIFNGMAGQRVSVNFTNGTYNGNLDSTISGPGGSVIGGTCCIDATGFADTVTLGSTGTYTILMDPRKQWTGSVTVQLNDDSTTLTGTITPGGPPVTVVTTAPGQDALLTFSGSAGQRVSLVETNYTYGLSNSYSPLILLLKPDGTNQASIDLRLSPYLDTQTLAATGTYTVRLHSRGSVGSVTLQMYDAPDIAAVTTPGGSAVTLTTVPGQDARLSFSGVAGQRVSLTVTGMTTNAVLLNLVKPDGTNQLSNRGCYKPSCFSMDVQTLATSGTYTIWLQHYWFSNYTTIGSVTLQLYDVQDLTGAIVSGGPPVTVTTTVPGQDARLTFNGTSGQNVSVLTSNFGDSDPHQNFPVLILLRPDGTTQKLMYFYGSYSMGTQTLITTGTYTLWFEHNYSSMYPASVTLQLTGVP